jgi:hypothetical protein
VLGIIALDTLTVLRHARPLSRRRVRELGMFLDFEGCANAVWDRKASHRDECRVIRTRLEDAGLGECLSEYLDRLRALESARPAIACDHRRFDDVRVYRESVARLALSTVAAIALNPDYHERNIHAAQDDSDVDTLFRILMQCQIIDDVLDYAEDESAGLPSFLTTAESLPHALALTAEAARHYAQPPERSGRGVFPLRVALYAFTMVATLVLHVAGRRHCDARQVAHR